MRGRWRFVLGLACSALLGIGAGESGSREGRPSFPPGVAELLPHAVTLWHWRTLRPFGGSPLTVLGVGDLTGDGLEDVVLSDSQAIHLFAAHPDGSFDERVVGFYEVRWTTPWSFTAVGFVRPGAGALADLDGDGSQDLVVGADGAQPALHVFQNRGHGSLEKKATLVGPASLRRLWVADYTGDGVLDVLGWAANAEGEGSWCLQEGRGPWEFGPPEVVASGQGFPFGLADVDGDGVLDLVLHHEAGLTVLLGGATGARIDWESPYGAVHHAGLSRAFPGQLRVVVATAQGLVYGGLAKEGFREEGVLPLGPLSWVQLVDVTGDGLEDALVRARAGWAVVPGRKDGGFGEPTSEFLFWGPLALRPWEAIFWPLRVGGQLSLLVGSEPYPMMYRTGFPPRGESLLPLAGTYLMAVGDLSGNGAPDLVITGAQGLEVLWNNGRGAFVRRPFLAEPLSVVKAAVAPGKLYLLNLGERARGRMAMELLTLSSRGEILSWEVLEEFALPDSNTVQPVLCVADFDADGEEDVLLLRKDALLVKWSGREWRVYPWKRGNLGLAVTGRFTRNGGSEVALLSDAGLFYVAFPNRALSSQETALQVEEVPLSLAGGDLDQDGLDDLVLLTMDVELGVEHEELSLKILGLRGQILLASQQVLPFNLPPLREDDVPWPLCGLVVTDVTGDRLADLAFTTTHGAGVFVLPGRGDGTVGPAVRLPRSIGPLFAADLDRSGQPELVGSTVGYNPYLWIRWNGGG